MSFKSVAKLLTTTDQDLFEMPATYEGAAVIGLANITGGAVNATLKFYKQADDATISFGPFSVPANSNKKIEFPIPLMSGDKIIMVAAANSSITALVTITDNVGAATDRPLTPKGEYSSLTTYLKNEFVYLPADGNSYVSLVNDNVDNLPSSSPSQWMVFAEKGETGDVEAHTHTTADVTDMTAAGIALATAADAAAQRTALALGTAAQAAIGTSGDTVPKLNADNSFSGKQTFLTTAEIQQLLEKAVIVTDNPASGDNNFDVLTGAVRFFTTANDVNWALNLRGSDSVSLNTFMATGKILTVALLVTNTGTAYYQTALKIDGNAVTPKWLSNEAPSSGNVDAIDVYTFSIIKTADATFTVLAQRVYFK